MTATETDLTADDVAWDLEPLLPEPGEAGVKALLDDADALGRRAGEGARPGRRVRRRRAGGVHDAPRRVARRRRPGRQLRRPRVQHRHHRSRARRADADGRGAGDGDRDQAACSSSSSGRPSPTSAPRRCSPTTALRSPRTTCARRAGTGRTSSPSPRRSCSPRRRSPAATRGSACSRSRCPRSPSSSTATTYPLEAGLAQLHSPDRDVRRTAAEAVTAGLAPGPAHTRVRLQHAARRQGDRRPLRHFDSWIASRNLSNEASDESVQALVDAVQAPLRDPATLVRAQGAAARPRHASPTTTAWRRSADTESRDRLGRSARTSCSTRTRRSRPSWPTSRSASSTSVDRRAGAAGQAPGAFCAYTVPSHHPYVLLNWTVRRRDVLTLAHELGHGAARVPRADRRASSTRRHRSRWPRRRRCSARPSRSAGCSTIIDDPQERLALLASNLEDQIATVFRQIAMNRFEHAMHTAPPRGGRAVGRALRRAVGGDTERDARRRGRAHRGLPHVVVVHPALHRDARLRVRVRVRPAARAVGVRALRGGGAPTSCPRYLDLLRAGGSMSPEELGRIVGVDLADPGFWDGGLDIVERRLEETEQAAATRPHLAGSDSRDLPRDPVEHRQRRPPSPAPASRVIPTSSSSACGCTAPTRPGRTRASSPASSPIGVLATNDVDALLALDADCVCYTATADLRPDRGDRRHGAHPRVGQERRVELGRAARATRRTSSPTMRKPARRRVRDAAACRASRRASTPAAPTTSCRSCSPARASTSTTLRVMEIVNYATYAQPTVLFDTMGFGQPLDAKPLLLIPGVLSFAWGGTVKALAAGLGVELDELREVHERRPAPRRHRPRLRRRRSGHDRGAALRGAGHRRRRSRASSLEHVTRLDDDLAPEWPQPVGRQRLPRHRHRQPELHVRRADDGRRRRPQHRRPRRHRGAASSTRSPRCATPRPGCSRCSTSRSSAAKD